MIVTMSAVHDSKDALPHTDSDEKHEEVQREYLAQDESPAAIEARKKEDALRRKLDRYVAPVMMMLMLISYLDRGNIGFAATQGMTTDIGLKGSQLNVSATLQLIRVYLTRTDCCVRLLHFLHSRRSKSSQRYG